MKKANNQNPYSQGQDARSTNSKFHNRTSAPVGPKNRADIYLSERENERASITASHEGWKLRILRRGSISSRYSERDREMRIDSKLFRLQEKSPLLFYAWEPHF